MGELERRVRKFKIVEGKQLKDAASDHWPRRDAEELGTAAADALNRGVEKEVERREGEEAVEKPREHNEDEEKEATPEA